MFYAYLGCYEVLSLSDWVDLEDKHPISDGAPNQRYNAIMKCYMAVTDHASTKDHRYFSLMNGSCYGMKMTSNVSRAADQKSCSHGQGGAMDGLADIYKILQCKSSYIIQIQCLIIRTVSWHHQPF